MRLHHAGLVTVVFVFVKTPDFIQIFGYYFVFWQIKFIRFFEFYIFLFFANWAYAPFESFESSKFWKFE